MRWLLSAVLALVALLGAAHLPPAEGWLGHRLAAALGLRVEGFALSWPFDPAARRLALADARGVWLEADGVAVDWVPAALLRGRIEVKRLDAAEIRLLRMPEGQGGENGAALPLVIHAMAGRLVMAPPMAPERLVIDLGGALRLLPDAVDLTLEARGDLRASAAVSLADGRLSVAVEATALPERAVAGMMGVPRLPPGLTLTLSGDGPLGDWRGALRLGDCLAAAVALDPVGRKAVWLDGTVDPRCAGYERAHGPLEASVRLSLPAGRIAARIGAGGFGAVTWRRIDAELVAAGPSWSGSGQVRALEVAQHGLDFGTVRWAGTARPGNGAIAIPWLALDSGVSHLWLSGRVGRDSRLLVRLRGDLSPLPFAAGGLAAELDVTGDLLAPRLRIAFAGRAESFASGEARADALLGPRPRLRGVALLTGDRLRLIEGAVEGAAASARLAGEVGDRVLLGLRARLPEGGGTALLFGSRADPALHLYADLRQIEPGGTPPFDLRAVVAAFALRGEPRGFLRAETRGPVAADLRGAFRLAGDGPRLDEATLVTAAGTVTGRDLSLSPPAGRLYGKLEDLAALDILPGLAGGLAFEATLAGDAADVTFETRRLSARGTLIGDARGTARLEGLPARPRGTARLETRNGRIAALDVARARVELEGSTDELAFRVEGDGAAGRPLRIEGAGRAAFAPGSTTLALDSLALRYGGQPMRLAAPTTVTIGEGVRLAPTRLDFGRGRLEASLEAVDGRLAGRVAIDALPLALARLVLPGAALGGAVSGQLDLAGSLAEPQARLRLAGRRITVPGLPRGTPPVTAELTADWTGGRVSADLGATAGRDLRMELSAVLPLERGLTVPAGGAVSGRLRGGGALGPLADLLLPAQHAARGRLEADLALSGTVENPLLDGRATLSDGSYENYQTGTLLREVTLGLTARRSRAFRLAGRGTDGGGGTVSAEGRVDLGPAGVIYQADLALRAFRLVRLDVLTGAASGTLALTGDGGGSRLSGALEATSVQVNLGERLPQGVARIEVTHVNAPPGLAISPPPAEAAGSGQPGAPFDLALDVGVKLQRAAMRGRGLQSEWQGDLRLGGTAAVPRVTGALDLVRGTYDLLGRSFALTRGRIAFAGADRIDPALDLVAESEASDITAQVVVAGSVREPRLEISSEPPLPSDEVMARLLFGKGVGQLDVGQQVQLARAAAGLAGGAAGGFDPVGGLRGVLGLDVLEVGMAGDDGDGNGEGGPTVSAGKYLGEDVFVRVDQGGEGTRFTVEMDLGAGFSVDTEVGAQTGGGVGLNWARDY